MLVNLEKRIDTAISAAVVSVSKSRSNLMSLAPKFSSITTKNTAKGTSSDDYNPSMSAKLPKLKQPRMSQAPQPRVREMRLELMNRSSSIEPPETNSSMLIMSRPNRESKFKININ